MVNSSRTLASVLALCISVITTLCLSLLDTLPGEGLVIAFVIEFTFSFVLIYAVLDNLIFAEVRKLNNLIDKIKKKGVHAIGKPNNVTLNPLKEINAEIYTFVDAKQLEIEELRKSEAFRKEFIADVSHELKTPIFAAQGFLHTLLDGAVNDKNVRDKFLRKAVKSIDRLDALVQNLLTLSQIETGQIKMHFELTDLYTITKDVFEQFENKADKKNVQLKIASDAPNAVVYADAERISLVMSNLISNAIKHSEEGSDVIVHFRSGKKNITTIVEDRGEGIPTEHLPRIFERFYTVDKSRSREKGGTGLGLAIVKHILDGHRTQATVESVPGKGSRFKFKLPKARPGKQVKS